MSEHRKIEQNVLDFMEIASKAYGKIQQESFSQQMFCDLLEKGMTSPIEDLFYMTAHLHCAAQHISVNPYPEFEKDGTITEGYGIFLSPQAPIGTYRVDFLITYRTINGYEPGVIVELDGHAFHDKDKHQRAYEKGRDRFLVKEGYKVLHFTGSEIFNDPHHVVYEALSTAGVDYFGAADLDAFDANDILGRR